MYCASYLIPDAPLAATATATVLLSMDNYQTDESGARFIAASQRPDGTWRKPRRVKDGYVPQEEVPVYESKGKQWVQSQPLGPIGLPEEELKQQHKSDVPVSKTAKKNARKKEKRKEKHAEELKESLQVLTIEEPTFDESVLPEESSTKTSSSVSKANIREDVLTENKSNVEKKLKNLKKKLRQIEDLEFKISSGTLAKPDPDQIKKVQQKEVIMDEIEILETLLS